MKPFQTTTGRILISFVVVAMLVTVAPRVYHSRADGWGNILSVVMLTVVAIGGWLGLVFGGGEHFFRGILIALFLFLMAVFILLMAWMIRSIFIDV